MSQAIVNAEDLENFAQSLRLFNEQLQESTGQLNGQFEQLGSTWRDQEHQKFAQVYQNTMQVIERFMETAEQHIPFLLRKAQRVREYLEQR